MSLGVSGRARPDSEAGHAPISPVSSSSRVCGELEGGVEMQAVRQRTSLRIEGAHARWDRLLCREWPAAQFDLVSTCCTPVLDNGVRGEEGRSSPVLGAGPVEGKRGSVIQAADGRAVRSGVGQEEVMPSPGLWASKRSLPCRAHLHAKRLCAPLLCLVVSSLCLPKTFQAPRGRTAAF